jgi:hypothetical protein
MPLDALNTFAADLQEKFSLPGTANPEDQLKGPVGNLLTDIGKLFGVHVATKTEAQLSEHNVRPDIGVYSDGLICGYIELKQPGLGANAPKLKSKHNKEQWEKLKNLPNLVYTDGREWALFRAGELVGTLLRFRDDPSQPGSKAIDDQDADRFEGLIKDFLFWAPHVPHKPTELAIYLAPLTRFLRNEVEAALLEEGSAVSLLAEEWRNFFFPDADNAQFADAYAQTITYALLLARLSGAQELSPAEAAKTLDKGNGLLARTVELLGQTAARDELRVGFELLQRSLAALDPAEFMKGKPDLWLYFYEDFLAAYDPKLRNDYGVYYTPREVVALQVRLAAELLEKRFKKKLGFADDGVVFLDPAVGTGTYLVATVAQALDKVRERSGKGAIAGRATQMAENMYGFEILVGPYAVAHLRLKQAIEGVGGALPTVGQGNNAEKRLKIYLTDTLESPFTKPPGALDLTHRKLTEEREAARKVKQTGDILVCLGNPPYDRQQIEEEDETKHRKGGWVRYGDQIKGGATQEEQNIRPIFSDFLEPGRKVGAGLHLKNLYNDYVYFWRWALWRLFEKQNCGGIVTFITASSYLAGPGFVGMREVMRRTFDELWIIDLGGDNLGTRKTPNVFAIQTPVAIGIGMRGPKAHPDTPAKASYVKVTAPSREDKLAKLAAIGSLSDLKWRDCPDDWQKPLRPAGTGDFFEWPLLSDLFPYSRSGSKFGRSWPIGETKDVLKKRFARMLQAKGDERKKLFKNNKYRKIERQYRAHNDKMPLPTIESLKEGTKPPKISPYAFRAFDRQWAIEDIRYNDRMGEVLWNIQGPSQVYFTSLRSASLALGPAIIAASSVPDLHSLRGSFGGKDVMPLWRDEDGTEPNVSASLLEVLSKAYGKEVSAEDFAAYVYALLANQSYTGRFWNELETPGARVPITADGACFGTAVALGRRLIWLHTYGKRFQPSEGEDDIPAGTAKCIIEISSDPLKYPESFEYDPNSHELHVGEGRCGPVAKEIWEFEVSGLKVVQSWLAYRMKVRSGKKSSPLDDIRPDHWTPRMTDELLELLWLLEASLAMEPNLSATLGNVISGPCFKSGELPQPTDAERKSPMQEEDLGDLLTMMGDYEDGPDED